MRKKRKIGKKQKKKRRKRRKIYVKKAQHCVHLGAALSLSVSVSLTKKNRHTDDVSLSPPTAIHSGHQAQSRRHQNLHHLSSSSVVFSAEGDSSSRCSCNATSAPSDAHSCHHRPPFPTPPPQGQPPRSPLPNGINRYAVRHSRKSIILFTIFFSACCGGEKIHSP